MPTATKRPASAPSALSDRDCRIQIHAGNRLVREVTKLAPHQAEAYSAAFTPCGGPDFTATLTVKPDPDPAVKPARFSVVIVKKATGKPIGLLLADCSSQHASAFVRQFNKRIRTTWPDRKAVTIPVL